MKKLTKDEAKKVKGGWGWYCSTCNIMRTGYVLKSSAVSAAKAHKGSACVVYACIGNGYTPV